MKKKKFKRWEKVFIAISFLFIVGCISFYGTRLIKYYKIYNPKSSTGEVQEFIMGSVTKNTPIVYEEDGLYRVSGSYVYKGEEVNNYIMYSGLLWRIVKFNTDGSLELVSAENLNILRWNDSKTEFDKTDVYNYLNNYFYEKLNKDNLTSTSICLDEIDDLNNITCEDSISSNVALLGVTDYLNSKVTSSYVNGAEIWTSSISEDSVWIINDSKLSKAKASGMYYLRPVVTLKATTVLKSGTGTLTDPYIINEADTFLGKYVKLGTDTWVVYDVVDDTLKLSLDKSLAKNDFGISTNFDLENEYSIAKYLNTTYYELLSYKSLLVEAKWYNGEYTNYASILNSSVTSKVGMLSITDIKLSSVSDYFLINKSSSTKVYLYSSKLLDSSYSIKNNIVPTICINKFDVLSGSGKQSDPYILEV